MIRILRGKIPENGDYSFPYTKWQSETSAIASRRSQDLSCYRKCKQQRFYFYHNRQAVILLVVLAHVQ